MQLWILPFLTFCSMALSLCGSAWFALYLRRERAQIHARITSVREKSEQRQKELRSEIGELRERLKAAEELVAENRACSATQGGLTLTRRASILRMHKRGERPEQIAAALALPQQEVELLLKLHLATVTV